MSIILVLARTLWKKVPDELSDALDSGRLLIVSPVSAARVSASTAAARNRWILDNSDSVYVGALDPAGRLARQISQHCNVEYYGGAPHGRMFCTVRVIQSFPLRTPGNADLPWQLHSHIKALWR